MRRDFAELDAVSYPALRRELNGRSYPGGAVRRVAIAEDALGRVPVVRFERRANTGPRGRGTVLFFHGGSYIFGSARTTHAEMAARLAEQSGASVIGVEYRLAPEHPYPAALEDALAAFDALLARGAQESDIVVCGDSAGGNLALCLQLALRDRGSPQARAAVLFSPWLDLSASRPSCRANDSLDYGQTSFLLKQAHDFAGGIALVDPRVSPLFARLEGLAPLFILAGGGERLLDEATELAGLARQAGVAVELLIAADMPHNPPALADFHPSAQQATAQAGQYIGGLFAPAS